MGGIIGRFLTVSKSLSSLKGRRSTAVSRAGAPASSAVPEGTADEPDFWLSTGTVAPAVSPQTVEFSKTTALRGDLKH